MVKHFPLENNNATVLEITMQGLSYSVDFKFSKLTINPGSKPGLQKGVKTEIAYICYEIKC